MLAWKLTTNFDTQRHLFSKKITTDYIIETFLCHCSHIEFITTHANEDIFSRLKVNLKKYLNEQKVQQVA